MQYGSSNSGTEQDYHSPILELGNFENQLKQDQQTDAGSQSKTTRPGVSLITWVLPRLMMGFLEEEMQMMRVLKLTSPCSEPHWQEVD